MDFNFLNKKVNKDTEERAADISAVQPSLDAKEAEAETEIITKKIYGDGRELMEVTNIVKTATNEIVASDVSYKEKIYAVVDVAATSKALEDEQLRKVLTDNKAEELKNVSEASRIESKTEIVNQKAKHEQTLYQRYGYVYELFGIKKEIPNFYCVVVLSIYAIFGTFYAIFIGIPFMIVNLFIDSLAALFQKINGLTKNVYGGLKYAFMCSMLFLVFAIIGIGLYYLLNLIGII